MKQCARCNALYAPRLAICPFCDTGAPGAPGAWVRTKSKLKTRQVLPVSPAVRDRGVRSRRFEHDEVDPAVMDLTVEISKAFLAAHTSDVIGLADGTDEAFVAAKLSDLWDLIEDETPTTDLGTLGEDDPHSYDLDDLVAPPDAEMVQNILNYGTETRPKPEPDDYEEILRELEALAPLAESSIMSMEGPSTDAELAHSRSEADRVDVVNRIVERSRALNGEPAAPRAAEPPRPVLPPPVPVEPTRPRFVSAHQSEEWEIGEPYVTAAPEADRPSPWVGRIASGGLAVMAGWALGTAVAWPVVAALVVGALALLLLTESSR